jgi:UDP-3-O-[3-hydroxymyristoyl] glucosamine N-acyltransferase
VCGLVGISGSCTLGSNVTLAGQVGLADHIKIGDKVIVGAKSGVKDHIPSNSVYLGIPAIPMNAAKRQLVAQARLPELAKRVQELERQLAELRKKSRVENRE